MARESYDSWDDTFVSLCEKYLDEEPLYPYDHLWKKGLSPKDAFEKYLDDNPDYAEKFQEITGKPHCSAKSVPESKDSIESAKKTESEKQKDQLAKQQQLQNPEKAVSKYCPNCARVMVKKGPCKCGYRRPSAK
ncbi:MAG: hypothetical protein HQM09_01625 [Candidatus Riflebacteria bacterium]|nr:hypothetical protein [Candidatus Riflebacteria bacterium]